MSGGTGSVRFSREACDALADVLAYPREGFDASIAACRERLAAGCPEAARPIAEFAAAVADRPLHELEELFTATFDFNPAATLEVGWHLFGEDYERGAFLVRMREEMRRFGVAESAELPDHLAHVLRVLGRSDAAPAHELARACVRPAVEKMRAALGDEANPYGRVLRAVEVLLAAAGDGEEGGTDHAVPVAPPPLALATAGREGREP